MQDDAPPPIPTPSARAEKSSPGERAVAPTEDMPTVLFGNFLVVSKLGEGGMGVVYEAKHQKIGRRAAVKVLHPELAQNQEYTERFLNEMRGRDSRREIAGIQALGKLREARAGGLLPAHRERSASLERPSMRRAATGWSQGCDSDGIARWRAADAAKISLHS